MGNFFAQSIAFMSMQFRRGFFGRVPEGQSSDYTNMGDLFRVPPLAKTVYVLQRQDYSKEQLALLVFLQGVVAQEEAAIFLDDSRVHHNTLERYKSKNPQQVFVDDIIELWDIVELFREKFHGKFVTYGSFEETDPTIIMASNIAATEGCLGIPAALREEALAHGLAEARDLRLITGSYVEKQQVILDECINKFRTNRIVMHLTPKAILGRDIGISQGALFLFTRELMNAPKLYKEERAFRNRVFQWADPAAKVLGFWADDDETVFINALSIEGKSVSPTSDLANSSIMLSLGDCGQLAQPNYNSAPVEGKHTICFYVTDGDNLNGVVGSGGACAPYEPMLLARKESGDTFPFAYTTNPLLGYLQPFTAEYLNSNDDLYGLGMRDSYIAGTSGLGACHTFQIPKKNLKDFAQMTAESMGKMDLHIFTSAEEILFNPFMSLYSKKVIDEFAQHDEIRGAFIQVSPWHYSGGKGRIYWSSNGKPWIAVRTTLWGKGGRRESVNDKWLDGFVKSLNKRSTNTSSISGYTVISIHPWSMSYKDIQYIVSRLDLNKVQIVSPNELLQMVRENVPHKDRKPFPAKAS